MNDIFKYRAPASRVELFGLLATHGEGAKILAGGTDLPTTVHPFILRGVTLAGVESVRCPIEVRRLAWQRLASEVSSELLDEMAEETTLAGLPALAEEILAGRTRGRVVVAVRP